MAAQAPSPTMRGGIPLFRFRGIDVRLHWTFLLLPAWIAFRSWSATGDASIVGVNVISVLLLFLCVTMHEYGHALTALRYGVRTRDITLLPIGGVASLERMPEDPKQEFAVTIAGPLVNLVLAIIGSVIIVSLGQKHLLVLFPFPLTSWNQLPAFLVFSNVILFLFNLVPAFPMDGGRILRSLLSMKMSRYKATRIATSLGRFLAIIFVIVGFLQGNPLMALIGVFIFFAAGAEARSVKHQNLLQGISVREVMRTNFWTLPLFAPIDRAVHELIAGGDKVAVVMDGERYVGVITRDDMLAAVTAGRAHEPIRENSVRVIPGISPNDAAHDMYTQLMTAGYPIVPVIEHGKLIGIFEPENLAEYVQLKQAVQGGKPA